MPTWPNTAMPPGLRDAAASGTTRMGMSSSSSTDDAALKEPMLSVLLRLPPAGCSSTGD